MWRVYLLYVQVLTDIALDKRASHAINFTQHFLRRFNWQALDF